MPGWIMILLILSVAAVAVALRLILRRSLRENMLENRVRTTRLYQRLSPVLAQCNNSCIERVIIRPEEVRIVLYKPANRVYRFVFERYGFDPVDQPQTLRALARAVAEDVPCLADRRNYFFSTHTGARDMGADCTWYEYTVQADYKDLLLRAWYDQPEEEIRDAVIR